MNTSKFSFGAQGSRPFIINTTSFARPSGLTALEMPVTEIEDFKQLI